MEAELLRVRSAASDAEVELKGTITQLRQQIQKLEKLREEEKTVAKHKIVSIGLDSLYYILVCSV